MYPTNSLSRLPSRMDLGEKVAVVLPSLFKRGWRFPIHFAAVGVNGTALAGSYEVRKGLGPERGQIFPEIVLRTKRSAYEFRLPIAVMFLEASTAKCVCVLFEDRELRRWHWC